MAETTNGVSFWSRISASWRRTDAPEAKASAAKPLIALHGGGAPAWTPRDFAALAREGYQSNVIAYRCIRMIAEAAAATPLMITDGGEVMTDHPLRALLRGPNPEQTGAELLTEFYGYLQTAGNAYLEAVDLDGEVRELYALRPDRVKVRVGEGGWPDSYEYSAGGRSVVFRRDAMTGASPILHLQLFHPLNDHYGMSPLEAAASAIDIHNAGAAWNKALLDNAARPSGALVYRGGEAGGNLTDEQFDRIKTELADAHQGADAAGRPLLLEGGLDWKPMSLSPADMDFLNAKNASAREIALAFGVPPMLLGIPGDNTYANYREANLAFHRQTVLPLVAKAAEAMTNWLGARFDAATIAPDIANAEATSAERDAMWARLERVSFLTINEKRAAAGYPPVDDGDALERR